MWLILLIVVCQMHQRDQRGRVDIRARTSPLGQEQTALLRPTPTRATWLLEIQPDIKAFRRLDWSPECLNVSPRCAPAPPGAWRGSCVLSSLRGPLRALYLLDAAAGASRGRCGPTPVVYETWGALWIVNKHDYFAKWKCRFWPGRLNDFIITIFLSSVLSSVVQVPYRRGVRML